MNIMTFTDELDVGRLVIWYVPNQVPAKATKVGCVRFRADLGRFQPSRQRVLRMAKSVATVNFTTQL